MSEPVEKVEHPSHYGGKENPYETIKVLAAWFPDFVVPFAILNTVKYLSRAGRKGGESLLDDLRKARWYINYAVEHLERK